MTDTVVVGIDDSDGAVRHWHGPRCTLVHGRRLRAVHAYELNIVVEFDEYMLQLQREMHAEKAALETPPRVAEEALEPPQLERPSSERSKGS